MKKLALSIFVSALTINSFTQDIHFSQYNEAPLQINPALTGAFSGDERIVLNYKNQWASFGAPYRTYALSFDAGIMKEKWEKAYLGIGLFVYSDRAGDVQLSTTQINISVASHISLNKKQFLSAGIQGGFAQKNLKGTDLKWGSQYNGFIFDPNAPGEEANFSSSGYGDFNVGIAWSYVQRVSTLSSNDNIWVKVGISYSHLTSPKQALYITKDELSSKYLIHAQSNIGVKNMRRGLRPSLLVMNQGQEIEITPGMLFRYMLSEESKYTGIKKESAISLGAYFRIGDAIAPTLFIEYSNFAIGINYDINISKLKAASNGKGGIEIVLRFINPSPFSYDKGTMGTPMM